MWWILYLCNLGVVDALLASLYHKDSLFTSSGYCRYIICMFQIHYPYPKTLDTFSIVSALLDTKINFQYLLKMYFPPLCHCLTTTKFNEWTVGLVRLPDCMAPLNQWMNQPKPFNACMNDSAAWLVWQLFGRCLMAVGVSLFPFVVAVRILFWLY